MIREIKIKLGGKERVFTFGLFFLGELLERFDVEYSEMLQMANKNMFKYMPVIMYESLKNTYKSEEKDLDFTEKDVVKWLEAEEDFGMNSILRFTTAFMGSQENKTPLEDTEEVEGKQKKN